MTQALERLDAEPTNGRWHTRTCDTHRVLDRAEFLATLETAALVTVTSKQALLLLDINDFQSVNDAFGTQVGDGVLEVIAHRLLIGIGPGAVVIGYEALLRWRTSDGTAVPTEDFVSVVESLGLIEQVGRWALDEAIGQARRLGATAETAPIMAVNLSARQFADPRLVKVVARLLDRYDVVPSMLALEITESLAVSDPNAQDTIRDLRSLGCHVGLDDFGTGQSCLSYLRSLPIDFIKIDRSFAAEVTTDERAARLIETIVRMAHDLGHCTVAEGIEDDGQCESLRAALCTFGQGYLFGRPAAPEAFTPGAA